jgi:hypothetical protein
MHMKTWITITLHSGKELVSNNVTLDLVEPDDWPVVACYAEALRRIADDELVALIFRAETDGFDINVEQCLTVLEQCRRRGIMTEENLTARLYGVLLKGADAAASEKSRSRTVN